MKRALVCGATGFIGSHLVKRLKAEGSWVRAVDLLPPRYQDCPADEVLQLDLRLSEACDRALQGGFDEVYQLAADMGGMDFISTAEAAIVTNNVLINANMCASAMRGEVGRYFYSSSVCVYRDMGPNESAMHEDDAYPGRPDNEYGWEKLYSERILRASAQTAGFEGRIGRFENCYGPYGAWKGGREKAPAALCRKAAELPTSGGVLEIYGDGSAVRTFVFVDDLVEAVLLITRSAEDRPTNIGPDEFVTVRELAQQIEAVSGKTFDIRSIDGPVGVGARNFSHQRLYDLGWRPRWSLDDGLAATYEWINAEVQRDRNVSADMRQHS